MAEEKVTRKLTTILAADVEGYTRLMRADEEATLKTLGEYRDVIDGLIARHEGRVFSTGGDSVLAEFGSVVEAVRCAISCQEEISSRNAELADDRKMMFRIGINVGDVMIRDGDLFGDGVNVAARLEGLAEAGGVCISGSVFEQIKHKLSLDFKDMGQQEVKNIAEPVSAYRLVPGRVSVSAAATAAAKSSRVRHWRIPAMAAAVVLIIAAGGLAIWRPWAPPPEVVSEEEMAFPLPDKPSIAVLSFDNLSGDPEQEYLSDGITEDIITNLSRFPGLFVIARKSTFIYKGKPVKVQQVSRELGVRYVLEGSVQVQKADDRVRISVQLVDATTGAHLWAERYDRDLKDIFALQDEVAQTIVARLTGLTGRLTVAEQARVMRKPTDSLDAYELTLRSRKARVRFTKEGNAESLRLLERAIELDPEYARAYAGLAWDHFFRVRLGWSESPAESTNRAFEFAQKAVALDDSDYNAHWVLGRVYELKKKFDQSLAEMEKALALNPNAADLVANMGFPLISVGRPEEAVGWVKKAMRLNPYYPDWYPGALGFAYYQARQYEEAIAPLKEAVGRNPKALWMRLPLAASYAQLGRDEEAREVATKILEINPEFSTKRWIKGYAFKDPADWEHYLDGLRKAGLPE